VKRQTRQLKRYFRPLLAPIAARIRNWVEPIRALLRPLRERLKKLLQSWLRAARIHPKSPQGQERESKSSRAAEKKQS
jgi:hypothetical protein